MIGETRVDLDTHKMLKKAYGRSQERPEAVKMKKKKQDTGLVVEKLWYNVYKPEYEDEFGAAISTGKVRLSFEVVPKELASGRGQVGRGRESPNFSPILSPPAGRFTFDVWSPLGMLRQIIGPDNYRKLCCAIMFAVFTGMVMYLLT